MFGRDEQNALCFRSPAHTIADTPDLSTHFLVCTRWIGLVSDQCLEEIAVVCDMVWQEVGVACIMSLYVYLSGTCDEIPHISCYFGGLVALFVRIGLHFLSSS